MPLPTTSDVHVNRPLTNLSVAYMQRAANFVATRAFPIVPVQKQSDAYFTYDQAYWTKDQMQVRAASTPSAGNGYAVDGTSTYFCNRYAFHKDIDDMIRANADIPLNLDREATDFVTQMALITRERLWAAAFFAGGIWTSYDYDGVAASPSTNEVLQWNDASSTPIDDVWAAKAYILGLTGYEPNKLILGYEVYKTLINHVDIIDRVKYGQTAGSPAMANEQTLAQIFGVDEILVMRGIYNTAKEGATASYSFIGGKKALLCYAPPSPGLMTPSAGYCFAWTGATGASNDGTRVLRFRMDDLTSDRVEIEMYIHMKLIAVGLGAFWDSVIA